MNDKNSNHYYFPVNYRKASYTFLSTEMSVVICIGLCCWKKKRKMNKKKGGGERRIIEKILNDLKIMLKSSCYFMIVQYTFSSSKQIIFRITSLCINKHKYSILVVLRIIFSDVTIFTQIPLLIRRMIRKRKSHKTL